MIRPATREDSGAVVGLAVAAGMFPADETEPLDGMMAEYFGGNVDEGHACVIDEEQGEPIGVAYYQPRPVADRVWDLTMIAVRPDRQGRGRETSGVAAYERTRAFYANLGYGEEARVRDYWAAGDDMVLFRKVLGAG